MDANQNEPTKEYLALYAKYQQKSQQRKEGQHNENFREEQPFDSCEDMVTQQQHPQSVPPFQEVVVQQQEQQQEQQEQQQQRQVAVSYQELASIVQFLKQVEASNHEVMSELRSIGTRLQCVEEQNKEMLINLERLARRSQTKTNPIHDFVHVEDRPIIIQEEEQKKRKTILCMRSFSAQDVFSTFEKTLEAKLNERPHPPSPPSNNISWSLPFSGKRKGSAKFIWEVITHQFGSAPLPVDLKPKYVLYSMFVTGTRIDDELFNREFAQIKNKWKTVTPPGLILFRYGAQAEAIKLEDASPKLIERTLWSTNMYYTGSTIHVWERERNSDPLLSLQKYLGILD